MAMKASIMNTSEFNERLTVIGIPEMLLWKTFYLLVGFKAFAKESASGVKPMSHLPLSKKGQTVFRGLLKATHANTLKDEL